MDESRPDTSPDQIGVPLTSAREAFGDRLRKLALPGGMTMRFRAGFVIVNSFTSFNLFVGVLSLIAAGNGQTALAAWGLLLCVLLDTCDGSLARHWNVTTPFGAQLDSLADMTSFSIASVALAYYWARSTTPFLLLISVCGLYALSGAIRLARFNSTTQRSDYFQGMPTTGGAAVLAALYLAAPPPRAQEVVGLVGLLAVLMVTTLPYPKLATLLRRCPAWFWAGAALSACLSLHAVIWVLSACYLCLGPAVWMFQRLRAER
jgi:CDP-diacylglycerol--serine O-phosphatidyltransferase